MGLLVSQSVTAMGQGLSTYFLGIGGTAPYTYSVRANGAGGTIDASTGKYTAPAVPNDNPAQSSDIIVVRDSSSLIAYGSILITYPIGLFCDILQNQLGLSQGRVYLWDQKINEPTDNGLFVAVSVLRCKPFGNILETDGSGSGLNAIQWTNIAATLGVDVISRGPSARDRKEEVLLALNSVYSEQQQELNSFYIGKIPPGGAFVNLSGVDGAAIPYRFNISVTMQYMYKKVVPVPYFDSFSTPQVNDDP